MFEKSWLMQPEAELVAETSVTSSRNFSIRSEIKSSFSKMM
jgi:hypothetical protein